MNSPFRKGPCRGFCRQGTQHWPLGRVQRMPRWACSLTRGSVSRKSRKWSSWRHVSRMSPHRGWHQRREHVDPFPAPSRTSLRQSLCRSVTPDTPGGAGLHLGDETRPTPHPTLPRTVWSMPTSLPSCPVSCLSQHFLSLRKDYEGLPQGRASQVAQWQRTHLSKQGT